LNTKGIILLVECHLIVIRLKSLAPHHFLPGAMFEEPSLTSIFDFWPFFESHFLTDCEIHIYNLSRTEHRVIPAHRAVLANVSEFFLNAFTSGMKEEETGIISCYVESPDLFEDMLKWSYAGTIDFNESDIMLLIHWSLHYGIPKLERLLTEELKRIAGVENVILLAQECFTHQIPDPLRLLEPIIGACFRSLPLSDLSQTLDVSTFARIIRQTDLDNRERVAAIREFLGDWNPSLQEKNSLAEALIRDGTLKEVVSEELTWLPISFIRVMQHPHG
jgi:hypothetical protein